MSNDTGMAFRPFPIDNIRTRSELRKRLMQHQATVADGMINGMCGSFDDYRYRVGQLRAFSIMLQELDEIEAEQG